MSYIVRQNPATLDNYTPGRQGVAVKEIFIHHAATTDFDGIGRTFQGGKQVSAHYGVGRNNNVDQYVQEGDTAWHCGVWNRNLSSIGIENVNSSGEPDWAVSEETFSTLVELVRDIAKRHNLLPLKVGVNLFGHKDVKATACPMHLYNRLQELADRVNSGEGGGEVTPPSPSVPDQILEVGSKIVFNDTYRVDALARVNGIWQVQTNALCPVDFTWNDNGIPVDPLTEVAGGVGNSNDQVLQVGSLYKLPGTFTVLNLGAYKGRWLAQIQYAGWKWWVDIETATEV